MAAQTYETRFGELLVKKVDAIRLDLHAQLATGAGIADFAAYREQVGYLKALTDLHSWCDEVATDLNKG